MPIPIHVKNKKLIIVISVLILIIITQILFIKANTQQTTISLSDVQVGDFYTHYDNRVNLRGINQFYSNVKKFSQDTLNKCYGLNIPEKDLCVQNQIGNASKYNLNVNKCTTQKYSTPLDFTKIKNQQKKVQGFPQDYGFHTISGQIIDINPPTGSVPTLTLKQIPTNEEIYVKLADGIGVMQIRQAKGQYLELRGIITQINNETKELTIRIGERGMSDVKQRYAYFNIGSQAHFTHTFADIAKQISDCAQSKNASCRCDIKFPNEHEIITFEKNNFYVNDTPDKIKKHYVSTIFDVRSPITGTTGFKDAFKEAFDKVVQPPTQPHQFVLQLEDVEAHEEESIVLTSINLSKLNDNTITFKKERGRLVILEHNYLPTDVASCTIEIKTYLFCAEYKDPTRQYTQESRPKMNFALKI
ncbi:MAG: hypothetical protein ACLFN8_03115 [Candidatus Woesearchaeota archaeon]